MDPPKENEPRTIPLTEPVDLDSAPTQITPQPQTAARGLPPGAMIADRYRVIGTLGAGGMGMVYRVHDSVLNVELALKMMLPEVALRDSFSARFRNELLLARQVSHRHVVRNHDLGTHDGNYFITMDLVEGRSLAAVLREEGPLDAARAIVWTRQIAAALTEAHRRGIVHRDLKPANVLIDQAGDAFVTDFGVARSLDGANLTRTGEVLGTPSYLSPEQARGETFDGRSDLYTLGVILIEMLSGKLPFRGGTLYEVLAQRMQGKILSLAEVGLEVDPNLARIIARCVEVDPANRYPGAAELVADLEALEAGHPLAGSEAGAASRSRRWRQHGLLAGGVAILVIVGALAVERLTSERRTGPTTKSTARDDSVPVPSARPRHEIAVLPLALTSDNSTLDWAATGVAELLASRLAANKDLRVVESVRVFQLLQDLGLRPEHLRRQELLQIAELFQTDRLVLGHLRTLGDRVQIELQLFDATRPDAPHDIGSQTGESAQLFELVASLGGDLSAALDASAPRAEQALPTVSAPAMKAYIEGLSLLSRSDTLGAAPALERAIAADPGFTLARVRLSQTYQSLGQYEEALSEAQQAVQSAPESNHRFALEARAQVALLSGESEQAQGLLRQLVEDYPNDAAARIALAEAYGQQGQFAPALTNLEKAAKVDPSAPRTWYLLGRYSIQSGDSQRAVDDYLVRALVQQNALHNEQGQAEVHNAFGVAHERLGRVEEAIRSYQQAAAIRERIGDRRGLAVSLHNLGALRLQSGERDAAEADTRRALELYQELGDRAGVANLELHFGALEEERGHYRDALDHYQRSLGLREALGDTRALAESHARVAYVYYLLGEYANALVYLDQGDSLFGQTDDPQGRILALSTRGLVHLERGDWQRSLTAFLEGLELSREIEQTFTATVAQSCLGRVAHYQGRYQAALQAFGETLDAFSQLGDARNRTQILLWEAETLLAIGAHDQVALRLEELEATPSSNLEQAGEARLLRALWHLGQDPANRADIETARSLLVARETRELPPPARLETQAVLGRAMLAAGEVERAIELLRSTLGEAQRISNALLQLQAGEALAAAALEAGDSELALQTLDGNIAIVERAGVYARSFRLHALRSTALRATGASDAADAEWQRAQSELARVRDDLDAGSRAIFDQLPEVEELLADRR